MVNKEEALSRLNKEKNYEDKIAGDLLNYYLFYIESIPDITKEQRKKIKEGLSTIANESLGHSSMFSVLIDYVLNNGKNNY